MDSKTALAVLAMDYLYAVVCMLQNSVSAVSFLFLLLGSKYLVSRQLANSAIRLKYEQIS